MRSKTLKQVALVGAVAVVAGIAQAAYTTYTEAIEAGRTQFQQGDYPAAQKSSEEALALAKNSSEKVGALLRLGLTYSQRKQYKQAREQWDKVLELPAASAAEKLQARSAIAGSYGEENDWERARAEFQKIVDTPDATPKDKATARFAIAVSFINQKNDAGAQGALRSIGEDTQVDANFRAMAYSQLGQNYLNAHEFDNARGAFEKAIELNTAPGELPVAAQAGIAESFKAEGKATEAQAEFVKAQAEAMKQSAFFGQRKQFAAARTLLEQALTFGQVAPTLDAILRFQVGESLLQEGKPQEARKKFEVLQNKQYGAELESKDQASVQLLQQSAQLGVARSYEQEQDKAQASKVLKSLLAMDNLNPAIQTKAQQMLNKS